MPPDYYTEFDFMSVSELPRSSSQPAAKSPSPANHPSAFDLVWHSSAPVELREAQARGDRAEVARLWRKHLQDRAEPRSIVERFASEQHPLEWGVADELSPGEEPAPTVFARVTKLAAHHSHSTRRWRNVAQAIAAVGIDGEIVPGDLPQAREALAIVHALPRCAEFWEHDTWAATLQYWASIAREAIEAPGSWSSSAWQLWAGELPLTLAYLFPEIESCRALGGPASEVLASGLVELLDDAGLPRTLPLSELPHLLACWTRCRSLVEQVDEGHWAKATQQRYRDSVHSLLHFLRNRHESLLVSPARQRTKLGELLCVASQAAADPETRRLAKHVLREEPLNDKRRAKLALPGLHAAGAKFAVLRTDWEQDAPRLAVSYRGRQLSVELCSDRETWFAGVVEPQVTWNDRRLATRGDWEESIWVSDADVDYLELELPLDDGFRLQRHMLLARHDRFMLWGDAVLAPSEDIAPGVLDSRLALPLGEGIEWQGAEHHCEGELHGRKRSLRVLPLGLPEWRSAARWGRLESHGTTLELRQSTPAGRNLFTPLFIDLDRSRRKREYTWRQLTVAEEREIVPADVAAGYRVQIGTQHWLIYRSLFNHLSRTLLGHHLLHEFMVGRFNKRGTVDSLLAIESQWGSPDDDA